MCALEAGCIEISKMYKNLDKSFGKLANLTMVQLKFRLVGNCIHILKSIVY